MQFDEYILNDFNIRNHFEVPGIDSANISVADIVEQFEPVSKTPRPTDPLILIPKLLPC